MTEVHILVQVVRGTGCSAIIHKLKGCHVARYIHTQSLRSYLSTEARILLQVVRGVSAPRSCKLKGCHTCFDIHTHNHKSLSTELTSAAGRRGLQGAHVIQFSSGLRFDAYAHNPLSHYRWYVQLLAKTRNVTQVALYLVRPSRNCSR
jgi:hypothetical protein